MKPATSIGLLLTLKLARQSSGPKPTGSPLARLSRRSRVHTAGTAHQSRRPGGDGDRETATAPTPMRPRRPTLSSPRRSVLRRGSGTRRPAGRDDRAPGAEPAGRLFPVGAVLERGTCGSALAAPRRQPLRLDHRQGARCGPVRSRGGDARRELGLALQHRGVRDAATPHPWVDRRRSCWRGGARGDRGRAVWRKPECRRSDGGRARDAASASAGRAALPGPWPCTRATAR